MTPAITTLWSRWLAQLERGPERDAVVVWYAEREPTRISWARLLRAAGVAAGELGSRGVRRGDVCALILRHHPDFFPLYLGISALGAIPSVLAYPNARLHPDKFVHGLTGMARRSGLDWILTERELEPVIHPLVSGAGSSVRGILAPLDWGVLQRDESAPEIADASPEAPCLLQHSSGTTGLQKAVVLSHAAVLGHIDCYAEAIGLTPEDKVVSWLPLYHDMGLIAALHLPLATGIPLVQLDPFEWVMAPSLLLDAISKERGTLSWLPNFAYNLLADRVRDDDIEGVRLESMRLFVNCSEPVRHESHRRFAARYAPLGLGPSTLSACYAMAETTFAATQSPLGKSARSLLADRDALRRGSVVPTTDAALGRWCVSSGVPIRGCEVVVRDAAGAALPEGSVGALFIRSESMFDGYRNSPDETALALRDGWYDSGDLGFVWEREVYVTGRAKDIIIHAGKNLFPEDIEDAVRGVPGVIPGRAVAFAIDDEVAGTEAVCVIAETDAVEAKERAALKLAIMKAAMGIDVTLGRVELAPARWLVKSSSGKLARQANKERLLAGELSGATKTP
ncbi:MAG: AMP-binding protein [Myxococcales bacterium]|nr:AMP-binding protein [Myxococcales bacterium]